MCEFILPPPPKIPSLLLVEAWSGKCLAHSWFHLGLQKARHKTSAGKSTGRKILKPNVNWKQVPELNIKLEHAKLVIRILFSYCLYSDWLQKLLGLQKHRSKGISFSLGSSKALLRRLLCFVLYSPPPHTLGKRITGLTHCGYPFVQISDVHKTELHWKGRGF